MHPAGGFLKREKPELTAPMVIVLVVNVVFALVFTAREVVDPFKKKA